MTPPNNSSDLGGQGNFSPFTKQTLIWWLVICAGVAVIYIPGLNNALIFDDERLRDGAIFSGYASLQFKERMISYGSFVWIQHLFGESWLLQRLINILMHLGVTLALYQLLRFMMDQVEWPQPDEEGADRTGLPRSKDAAAILGVTVFALNPVAVYSVAYLVQRSILMATLFSVLSLYAVARAGADRGRATAYWLLGAAVSYVLALFSKEHVVLLPVVAMAIYWIVRRPDKKHIAQALMLVTALLTAGMLFLFDRFGSLFGQVFDTSSQEYLSQLTAIQPGVEEKAWPLSMLNQSWLFFKYGVCWVLPYPGWLSIDLRPAFPVALSSFPHVAGAFAYLATLGTSLWLMTRYSDWRRFVGLGVFAPLVLFVTEFATVWIQDPFVLYRSYLWAIGIPFLAAFIWIGSTTKTIKWAIVVTGIILAGLSLDRTFSLRTEASAWADAAQKIDLSAPANAVGRWRPLVNYGNQLIQQEQFQQATQAYAAAVRTGETTGIADYHLGLALLKLGQYQPAIEAFDRAESRKIYTSRNPGRIAFYKGQALFYSGRFELAIQWLDDALPRLSDVEDKLTALETRAKAGIKLGKPADAVSDYSKMIELAPGHRNARIGLAMALNAAGQHQDARNMLDRMLSESDTPDLRVARIIVLLGAKQVAEARNEILSALNRYPGNKTLQQLAKQLGL